MSLFSLPNVCFPFFQFTFLSVFTFFCSIIIAWELGLYGCDVTSLWIIHLANIFFGIHNKDICNDLGLHGSIIPSLLLLNLLYYYWITCLQFLIFLNFLFLFFSGIGILFIGAFVGNSCILSFSLSFYIMVIMSQISFPTLIFLNDLLIITLLFGSLQFCPRDFLQASKFGISSPYGNGNGDIGVTACWDFLLESLSDGGAMAQVFISFPIWCSQDSYSH